jgi:hypothetical protein
VIVFGNEGMDKILNPSLDEGRFAAESIETLEEVRRRLMVGNSCGCHLNLLGTYH